ncbi:MAG: deoxyribose-phosphate aldolase [Clostridiales bacterium GWF2_36_10]|nr:MAG: deoxyribose-phosphate aldolase [Clostridiales bacterium GWF2_36_10]
MFDSYTSQDIISKIDHTNLKQTAVWEDIKKLCDEGIVYGVASVCIPPCFVRKVSDYSKGRLKICTVIGFPNGYSTSAVKCYETSEVIKNGADEIDMVINIGMLKDGNYDELLAEINIVKNSCEGRILKVIIETCLLTDDEKIKISEIVSKSNADYIKTSTGFSKHGVTKEDIDLLKKHCIGKKVKAAGGIKSIDDAVQFLDCGADRLGSSSLLDMLIAECEAKNDR